MRTHIGLLLHLLSRAMVAAIPAVLRPRDLAALYALKFRTSTSPWADEETVDSGLSDSEEELIPWAQLTGKKALVLFAGGGRESIALAKRGFDVTAVEISATMAAALRGNAEKQRTTVECKVGDVAEMCFGNDLFDCGFALSQMYSSIPGRRTRVGFLHNIRRALRPGGFLLLGYFLDPHPARSRRIHRFQKIVAVLTAGNMRCEPGDKMLPGLEFYHHFGGPDEVDEEVRAAGFEVCLSKSLPQVAGVCLVRRPAEGVRSSEFGVRSKE